MFASIFPHTDLFCDIFTTNLLDSMKNLFYSCSFRHAGLNVKHEKTITPCQSRRRNRKYCMFKQKCLISFLSVARTLAAHTSIPDLRNLAHHHIHSSQSDEFVVFVIGWSLLNLYLRYVFCSRRCCCCSMINVRSFSVSI